MVHNGKELAHKERCEQRVLEKHRRGGKTSGIKVPVVAVVNWEI